MKPLTPAEILEVSIDTSVSKCKSSISKLLILGIMAGAYIALAGAAANMGAFNLLSNPETFGIGKLVSGILFPTGLMIVVLSGAELFTGNNLIVAAVLEKKVTIASMLRNWIIVYFANFIGALIVAWMISESGLLSSGGNMLGAMSIRIAVGKVNLTFLQGVILGLLCNALVCLAVWMTFATHTAVGKIMSIFFPICLFVTAGFEHSIANMFYIPVALFSKTNETFVALSGVTQEAFANLTWSGFLIDNLIPVTLGNIIGGAIFVALAYWYAYKKA